MTCSFYLGIIITFVCVCVVYVSMSVSIPIETCDFLIAFYLIYFRQSLLLSLKLFWLGWLARKFLSCPLPSLVSGVTDTWIFFFFYHGFQDLNSGLCASLQTLLPADPSPQPQLVPYNQRLDTCFKLFIYFEAGDQTLGSCEDQKNSLPLSYRPSTCVCFICEDKWAELQTSG